MTLKEYADKNRMKLPEERIFEDEVSDDWNDCERERHESFLLGYHHAKTIYDGLLMPEFKKLMVEGVEKALEKEPGIRKTFYYLPEREIRRYLAKAIVDSLEES
jgi:hypothetical protein